MVSGGSRAALGWAGEGTCPYATLGRARTPASPASNWPRSLAVPDKKVRFDDFELDYGRFTLCRSGRTVKLEACR